MVTMRDVADLAGVSITTVSHVVNDTRPVAAGTRDRVLAAVEQTGYTGDAIARSLVTGGTKSIGLALPIAANSHFAGLAEVVERAATAAGYALLLADTQDADDRERAAIRALRTRRVDGLLLTPSAHSTTEVLPQLRSLGVPTVLLDRLPEHTGLDQVGPENVQATSDLTRHLGEAEHRRIAMVTGPETINNSAERLLGYRLGLGRAKLVWDPELVVSAEPSDLLTGVERLLDLPSPPTGVVAGDGTALIAVLRAARRRGLRIGSDLCVVAHDDPEWADLVEVPLSTTAQPIEEMGATAVRMLLERIAAKDEAAPPRTVRIPPTFVHRASCGCPTTQE